MSPPSLTAWELLDRHALLLLDAYGVLVDGQGALPGAAEFLRAVQGSGHPFYVVTNDASRMPESIATRLAGYGLALKPEHIVSSGSLIADHLRAAGLIGARCAVLGPVESYGYLAGLAEAVAWPITDPSSVDALVITDEAGYPFLERVDEALSLALSKVDRGERLALVVPNPDLIYPQGPGRFGLAAGSIAQLIESAIHLRHPTRTDIVFARLGKPYAPIFEEALRRGGTRDAVMVGDQLETDIKGAKATRIAAALVGWGVAAAWPEGLPETQRPDYWLTGFGDPLRPRS